MYSIIYVRHAETGNVIAEHRLVTEAEAQQLTDAYRAIWPGQPMIWEGLRYA